MATSPDLLKKANRGLAPDRPGKPRRSPVVLGACLAASWLLPMALVPLHLGLLLLPALVLLVASLLRVGGGLLDRLVVAGLVVCGGVLVFGLLFSFWPWGIAPVPTTGLLLSVTSAAAWSARRRPRLPIRVRPADLLVLGTAYGLWHYLHRPLIGRSPGERLEYIATAEDRLGHLSYFDGIQHLGGYNFLHQAAARAFLIPPAEVQYPQGSHFLLAWIDDLVRSSATPDSGVATVNRYFIYVLVAYSLLGAALVWAARWIGGPRLRGWRCALVCGSVAALLMASNWTDLVIHGFDSTIIGLLFVTVTLALFVRPAMGRAEFALVSVAGLVTVTYSYNLYGCLIALALVGTSVVNRRRFTRRRWLLHGVQVVGLAVAWLPSAISVFSDFDVAGTANLPGPIVSVNRTVLLGGGLLALLVALSPISRRTAAGRSHLAVVLAATLVIGGFGAWQMQTLGHYSYYFEKIAACGVVVALISLGAVGTALHAPVRPRVSRRGRTAGEALASAVALVVAFAVFAGMQFGLHDMLGGPKPDWDSTPLNQWSKGQDWTDIGPRGGATVADDLRDVSGPVIVLYSNDSYKNLKSTWLAALLRHRGGDMEWLYGTHWVGIGAAATLPSKDYEAQYRDSITGLEKVVRKIPVPPTILVADRAVGERISRDLAAQGLRATVRAEPQNLWTAPYERNFLGD